MSRNSLCSTALGFLLAGSDRLSSRKKFLRAFWSRCCRGFVPQYALLYAKSLVVQHGLLVSPKSSDAMRHQNQLCGWESMYLGLASATHHSICGCFVSVLLLANFLAFLDICNGFFAQTRRIILFLASSYQILQHCSLPVVLPRAV